MDQLFCCCHRTQNSGAKAGEQAESLELTVLPMRARKNQKVIDHSSSTFDSFLEEEGDRKSTRLNSSHRCISYAVFCLKKKKKKKKIKQKKKNKKQKITPK